MSTAVNSETAASSLSISDPAVAITGAAGLWRARGRRAPLVWPTFKKLAVGRKPMTVTSQTTRLDTVRAVQSSASGLHEACSVGLRLCSPPREPI